MFQTRNVIDDKLTRKEMTYHRIGNKPSSSYLKAFPQYNHHILPPIIKMLQLSHVFLTSITTDIIGTMNQSVNAILSIPVICKHSQYNFSKSISTSHDNPPILQSFYPILDKLSINTSDLNDKPLDVIYLKNFYLKSVVF